jgi:hypothetical protein
LITIVRAVFSIFLLFTFAYGLVSLCEAAKRRVTAWWARRQVPRRGLAPVAWARDASGTPRPVEYQRDEGDETDIVPEGLGYTPALKVRDGELIPLYRLKPVDQRVFSEARRRLV